MELRTLQYFLTVAREENITRASEVLHITQPTLSRQMKQLEQELGTELFVRGRNFALTEAGMLLRRRAEEVVDMMYKIESEIETAGEVGGVISIGSGALKSSQFLPEVMSAFQKLHPKVRFEIYSNSSQYIKERMDRGLLDFGIMLEPIDIEQYEYIRLEQKERWGLLMRRGHPLAEQDNMMTHAAMFINSGAACGLTIEGAVDLFEDSKMVFKPLNPRLELTAVLAWKRFHSLSGAAAKFLDYLRNYTKNA